MADYKETNVAGSSYRRCNEIHINNGLDHKSISFREQDVVSLGDDNPIFRPAGGVSEVLTEENLGSSFSVLDPTSGEPTGTTMTCGETYAILYSLYLHMAVARDDRIAAEAEAEAARIAAAEAAAEEAEEEEPPTP